jgi:hypothetical protein
MTEKVFMRMPTGDCMIAAMAMAAAQPYETIAGALGFTLDPKTGAPIMGRWPWPGEASCHEVQLLICDRLTSLGVAFLPLFYSRVPAEMVSGLFRAMLDRNSDDAVLFIKSDREEDNGKAHAVAYLDGKIVDCRVPAVSPRLDDIDEIYSVMVKAG